MELIEEAVTAGARLFKACEERFKDRTPYEIVAILLDEGSYLASVSTFYRILSTSVAIPGRGTSRAVLRN